MSSSPEVLNSVFDELGCTIDEEQGLKHLAIDGFWDMSSLQEWPLGQLLFNCHHLESLKIADLSYTTEANIGQLLEFAGLAAGKSNCLHTLVIKVTKSSAHEGDKFMKVLAKSGITQLQELTISRETNWFKGRNECLNPLLDLLDEQRQLRSLDLRANGLTDD